VLVLEGAVWARIGGETYTVGPDLTAIIPPSTPHSCGNSGAKVACILFVWDNLDPFRNSTYFESERPKERT